MPHYDGMRPGIRKAKGFPRAQGEEGLRYHSYVRGPAVRNPERVLSLPSYRARYDTLVWKLVWHVHYRIGPNAPNVV